jgi:hypothetical protein
MRWNRNDPEAVRRWHEGVSVYDDFDRACELAADNGFNSIATVVVEEPSRFEVSQYGRDQRHYTIFGEPEQLMALVSAVHPVSRAPGE